MHPISQAKFHIHPIVIECVYIYIHLVSWISIEPIFQQKTTQKLHPTNDVTWPTSLDMVRIQGNSTWPCPSHPIPGMARGARCRVVQLADGIPAATALEKGAAAAAVDGDDPGGVRGWGWGWSGNVLISL